MKKKFACFVLVFSALLFQQALAEVDPEKPIEYIDVPTGAAIFPAEIFITPKSWAEASYDLRHWTVMSEGGHFAALQKPQLYLNDLREFFRLLR